MKTLIVALCCFTQIAFAQERPAPAASQTILISGKSNGLISRNELLQADGFHVIISNGKDSKEDTVWMVVSYKFSLFGKNREPVLDMSGKGPQLTDDMRKRIAEHPAGTKVYFEYIVIRMKTGSANRLLPPLAFELSD